MANLYGPRIVTDGLMIYLDPANRKCYPGSGTTMYDLSGRGNNATMYNGISISSNVIGFDGTNDYLQINDTGTNFDGWATAQTLLIWMYHSATQVGRRNPWNQAYGGYGTWTHELNNTISSYWGDSGANATPYAGRASASTPRNQWICMGAVRNTTQHRWFKDGARTATYTHTYGTLTNTSANVLLGTGYVGGYWSGQMGLIMAYERDLTDAEVLQNYNALKGRFGR
jgi:hypothetical protein